jgi:hypothetical protein
MAPIAPKHGGARATRARPVRTARPSATPTAAQAPAGLRTPPTRAALADRGTGTVPATAGSARRRT